MKNLRKIDCHHHLWDLSLDKHLWLINENDKTEASFLGDYQKIKTNYLIEDYLRDIQNQNVEKSVHLQAGWTRDDSVGETAWLQSVADEYGFPHGIVAYVNLLRDDAAKTLESHCQFENIRGIRQILSWHPDPFYSGCDDDYIINPTWQENFGLLEKYNLSFDMQIYPIQMSAAVKLANKYPNIQIIINHAGMPLGRNKEDFLFWEKSMTNLAACPNVVVKISGLGMFDHHWTIKSIRPYIETIILLFGIDRCMFASNFPVDELYSTYDTLFRGYTKIVKAMSIDEKTKLFHDNAERIYRL